MQLRQALMRYFFVLEKLWNNAVHLATLLEHTVGDYAHCAYGRPAIHKFELMPYQHIGEFPGRIRIFGSAPNAGATVDANSLHAGFELRRS